MRKRSILALLLIALSSCNKINQNAQLNVGFSEESNGKISPWLKTAVKGDMIQESKVSLAVYAGYYSHFQDSFVDGIYKDYSFAIQREIWSEDWQECYKTILEADLSDFNNEEKFVISFEEDANGKTKLVFGYSFIDAFDCDSIILNKGIIDYTICLLDSYKKVNEEILLEFGISLNYVNFKKDKNIITFSY